MAHLSGDKNMIEAFRRRRRHPRFTAAKVYKIAIEDRRPLAPGPWRNRASHYPATGEPVAWLNAADLQDVEDAIQGAHQAFLHSGWAQRKPHERAAVLYRIAELIRLHSEELAQLQRQDNGKPINETRALVASAAGTFQFFAAACETLEETITPSRGDFVSMSVYEPMGVVAAITPWNSPIASEAQKVAPARPRAMRW